VGRRPAVPLLVACAERHRRPHVRDDADQHFSSREDHYVAPSRAHSADWEDAIAWDGATHVGVGRRILERLRWWELRPAPEAIEPHAAADDWFLPYASRHPDGTVVVYLPGIGQSAPKASRTVDSLFQSKSLVGLEPGVRYHATYVNPRTGAEEQTAVFESEDGRRPLGGLVESPTFPFDSPTWEDWVLVVRPVRSVTSVSQAPWPA
jgi:hypothetical protein